MQTTSARFDALAQSHMRPLSWGFKASFSKSYDPNVSFFQLDVSTLDGSAILAPSEDNVIQSSDRYNYLDYTNRVIQMEWQREEDFPYSVNLAIADVVLNNYDKFFTYGVAAKTENISENFNQPLDPANWYNWGGGVVNIVAGEMVIASRTTGVLAGIHSVNRYDLTGSYVQSQLVNAGNQSIVTFSAYPVSIQNDADNAAYIYVNQNFIHGNIRLLGIDHGAGLVAYNSSVHKYFRIREASGTLYFDYSTDDITWTNFGSGSSTGIDVTKVRIDIYAGAYGVEVSTTTAVFDNFNSNADGSAVNTANVSPVAQYMLPRRPIRLLAGFGGDNLPQFVGLTEKSPQVDYAGNTATIHAQDFLSFIFGKPLNEVIVYQNKRTDEVLDSLFQLFGLSANQYELDQGYNTIEFVYFTSDMRLGDAVRKLMQAEMGSLYMDELGVIHFKNRTKAVASPVYSFDKSNIVDLRIIDESSIINVVEIKADIRKVQPVDTIYTGFIPTLLSPGSNEVFFNFSDPVTSINPITVFTANTQEDGSGTDETSDVTITSTVLFNDSVKVTFNNANGSSVWLTGISIDGTAAPVVDHLYLRVQDDTSVGLFEEQPLLIENSFIQDYDTAQSIALSILNTYKDYSNTIEIDVHGNMALQIGDSIQVSVGSINGQFIIKKIVSTLENGRYRQIITARVKILVNYFVLDTSDLDDVDVLAP